MFKRFFVFANLMINVALIYFPDSCRLFIATTSITARFVNKKIQQEF